MRSFKIGSLKCFNLEGDWSWKISLQIDLIAETYSGVKILLE